MSKVSCKYCKNPGYTVENATGCMVLSLTSSLLRVRSLFLVSKEKFSILNHHLGPIRLLVSLLQLMVLLRSSINISSLYSSKFRSPLLLYHLSNQMKIQLSLTLQVLSGQLHHSILGKLGLFLPSSLEGGGVLTLIWVVQLKERKSPNNNNTMPEVPSPLVPLVFCISWQSWYVSTLQLGVGRVLTRIWVVQLKKRKWYNNNETLPEVPCPLVFCIFFILSFLLFLHI